jgi:hypothetical protein
LEKWDIRKKMLTIKKEQTMSLRDQFRKEHPETIGEKDKSFDDGNYIAWLEEKMSEKTLSSNAGRSFCEECNEFETMPMPNGNIFCKKCNRSIKI